MAEIRSIFERHRAVQTMWLFYAALWDRLPERLWQVPDDSRETELSA